MESFRFLAQGVWYWLLSLMNSTSQWLKPNRIISTWNCSKMVLKRSSSEEEAWKLRDPFQTKHVFHSINNLLPSDPFTFLCFVPEMVRHKWIIHVSLPWRSSWANTGDYPRNRWLRRAVKGWHNSTVNAYLGRTPHLREGVQGKYGFWVLVFFFEKFQICPR